MRDAQPGDVLEIELQAIAPSLPVGFNAIRTGWGALPQEFSQKALRFIPLDLAHNIADFPPDTGIKIPLKPFFGILCPHKGVHGMLPKSIISNQINL